MVPGWPIERIITAVETCDGAYVDGNKFDELYSRSKECGCNIKEFYGDKAYFRKPILDIFKYTFDKAMCKDCPHKVECAGKTASVKRLDVGINTTDYYEHSQRAQTQEFKEKYKKRASHEWKNGEMKHFHGLDRARGYGLKSMSMQAKLTALAVNLKRIAALVSLCLAYFKQILLSIKNSSKIMIKKADYAA